MYDNQSECINGKKCVSVSEPEFKYLDYEFNVTTLTIKISDSYKDWKKIEVWNIISNILSSQLNEISFKLLLYYMKIAVAISLYI